MIELSHLRIVQALHEHGTLTRAAQDLCLTQSALSHQIRQLEQRAQTAVWERDGRRLSLTAAGLDLLACARRVLPQIDEAEQVLRRHADGVRGVLRIGVECYPCYEWLTGAIGHFLKAMPDVEVDILGNVHFSGIDGLINKQVDMLITPDPHPHRALCYEALFDYELVLLVAASHRLAPAPVAEAAQLAGETLLSFPVANERLDIFTEFFWPAGVRPLRHKRVHSVDIMVQMVAHGRGVCALPAWLARRFAQRLDLHVLRLGAGGVHKTLYAAVREPDLELGYVRAFIGMGQGSPGQA